MVLETCLPHRLHNLWKQFSRETVYMIHTYAFELKHRTATTWTVCTLWFCRGRKKWKKKDPKERVQEPDSLLQATQSVSSLFSIFSVSLLFVNHYSPYKHAVHKHCAHMAEQLQAGHQTRFKSTSGRNKWHWSFLCVRFLKNCKMFSLPHSSKESLQDTTRWVKHWSGTW